MKRIARVFALVLTLGITLGIVGTRDMDAQQPALKRTELLRVAIAEMDGKEAHVWIAGHCARGSDRQSSSSDDAVRLRPRRLGHPRDRSESPRTYGAGEVFAERPDVPHNFKNASVTASAKALGLQIAGTGQALQY